MSAKESLEGKWVTHMGHVAIIHEANEQKIVVAFNVPLDDGGKVLSFATFPNTPAVIATLFKDTDVPVDADDIDEVIDTSLANEPDGDEDDRKNYENV